MEYTKGNWRVSSNWNFPDYQGRTGLAVYNTINKTDMLICELVHSADAENREANAQLISAAPDMYEALKTVFTCFDFNKTPESLHAGILIEQALAKAEGK